jgi:hypothetical protein
MLWIRQERALVSVLPPVNLDTDQVESAGPNIRANTVVRGGDEPQQRQFQHIIQESTNQQAALRKITDKTTSKVDQMEMGHQYLDFSGCHSTTPFPKYDYPGQRHIP